MKYLQVLSLSMVITLIGMMSVHAEQEAGVSYAAPPLEEGVPVTLDLPEKFKPPKQGKKESLGFRFTSGIALEKQGGTIPICVVETRKGHVPNDVLVVGDIILAVNGKPFDEKKGARRFREALGNAKKTTGFIWLTRWRPSTKLGPGKGKIERCFVDLGTHILDLTKSLTPGPTRDWRLGPLGANGWCFHRRANVGASRDARQLLITAVDKDGPSAGKLQLKDVIIGADGKMFSYDVRKALAAAINEAEKEENKGQLKLRVWREGKATDVVLSLPVLGTYSDTAPFNCPKTEKIVENGVAYMKANADTLLKASEKGWINYINGLGLLATGRDDVMPMVKNLAHGSMLKEGEKLSVEQHVSMMCWWWSYKTLFLTEYYLRTGDKAVLPTIDEHATKIAMGQSGAGTWGHTYAARANTGHLHGHLGGYGAINQQGLTLMIALPLAYKCGIKNQEVTDAIKRGYNFFSFFVGRGTIPYGDHGPANHWYDDNGKSGSAAIFFDIMGKQKSAEFFSEMILGSVPSGREVGHTGHYWSHLWGGIGAVRGGDKALQVYMKEMTPIFTLERQPCGRFAFQDNVGEGGTIGDPKEKWDCTGARLLQLCVPKRQLYITGKNTPKETHMTDARIEEILKAGRLDINKEARARLTKDEILAFLKDPLPPTRAMAAKTLAERNLNYVDELIAMLDSDNPHARYGAAEGLCKAGFANKAAADKLIELMQRSTDITFQLYAISALTNRDKERGLLSVAKPAIPVLMKMALKHSSSDPRRVLQNEISEALFYDGRAQPRRGLLPEYGLDGIDRSLLVAVIKEILTNENGRARSGVAKWVYPHLTSADREQLWGDIYKAANFIAPSGIMFATQARTEGLKLMAEHHIKEGLDLAVWYIRFQKGHGSRGRVPIALAAIEKYGAHAKRVIPELEKHAAYYESTRNKRRGIAPDDPANRIRETIKKIEALPDKPAFSLVSIADTLKKRGIEFPPKPITIQTEQ